MTRRKPQKIKNPAPDPDTAYFFIPKEQEQDAIVDLINLHQAEWVMIDNLINLIKAGRLPNLSERGDIDRQVMSLNAQIITFESKFINPNRKV